MFGKGIKIPAEMQQVMMKDRIIQQQQLLMKDRILQQHGKKRKLGARDTANVASNPAVAANRSVMEARVGTRDLRDWDAVQARYKGQKGWHRCTVKNGIPVASGENTACKYDVTYADGDKELAVARYRIRRVGEGPRLGADGKQVFAVGDLVDALYQGGKTYYAARVTAVGNDKVDLQYLDGDTAQGVAVESIEGLCGEIWPAGVVPSPLRVGDRVEGRWHLNTGQVPFYRGAVLAVNTDGRFKIGYDDGDLDEKVDRRKLRMNASEKEPAELKVGQDVDVIYGAAGTKVYSARISAVGMVDGARVYDVCFDDGDKESSVPRALIYAASLPGGSYSRSSDDVDIAREVQKARLTTAKARQQLVEFYESRYAGFADAKEAKLQQVDSIMRQYKGREQDIENVIAQVASQEAAPPVAPA
jgi:hypothetical protein